MPLLFERKLHLCIILSYANIGVFTFLVQHSFAYPNGAPVGKCVGMDPSLTSHGGPPQTSVAPFFFTISNDSYTPGNAINVTLEACSGFTFTGFLLEARQEANTTAVGMFTTIPSNTKLLTCSNSKGGVTHSDDNGKTILSFEWTPANDLSDDVAFYVTIVRGPASVYWIKHKSPTIKKVGGVGIPLVQSCPSSTPANSQTTVVSSVVLILFGVMLSFMS